MKIKVLYVFLFVLFAIDKSNAQVNLQTGSAVFSLPVFNWQDSKSRLSLNVGLNYNSGNGLKVDEIASNVGSGWNLMAGGVISRMQVGQPDDQMEKVGAAYDLNKYPPGYLFNSRAGLKECPIGLIKYPVFRTDGNAEKYKQSNSDLADRELDYFNFNFNGRAGIFVLNKQNPNECYVIGDSKLKISYQIDATKAIQEKCRTVIMSFVVIDENGVKYKFDKIAKSAIMKYRACNKNRTAFIDEPAHDFGSVIYKFGQPIDEYVVNEWYLTKISDELNNRSILIQYNDNYTNIYSTKHNGYSISFTGTRQWRYENAGINFNQYVRQGYVQVDYRKFDGNVPNVSKIDFPDGYYVDFKYENSNRKDVEYLSALQSIDISIQGTIKKSFELTTNYFKENQIVDANTADVRSRLCLTSITEYGPNKLQSLPSYNFSYYLGSNNTEDFVPPLHCASKDYAGYYNGSNATINNSFPIDPKENIESFNFDELVSFCFVKRNQSIFPTCISSSENLVLRIYGCGSYLSSSGISIKSKNKYAQNGLLSKIQYPTGGYIEYIYEQNYGKVDNLGADVIVGGVHIAKINSYENTNAATPVSSTLYTYTIKGTSNSSLFGVESPVNKQNFSSRWDGVDKLQHLLWCEWRYSKPGLPEFETAPSKLTSSGSNTQKSIEKAVDLIGKFYGGSVYGLCKIVAQWIASCTGSALDERDFDIFYNYDFNTNNPLPIQFSCVTVEQIDNSNHTNGSIVYEYSQCLFWDDFGGNSQTLNNKQRYGHWLYGQPILISMYDKNNKLVKLTEYNYDDIVNSFGGVISCNCYTNRSEGEIAPDWENRQDASIYANYIRDNSNSNIVVTTYGYKTGRRFLTRIVEKNYKQNYTGSETDPVNYTELVTLLDYNTTNYQANKITQYQANGDKLIKEIYYPTDYSGVASLQALRNNNILNTPVATYQSIIKNGTVTQKYLSANVTDFATVNGDIKPLASYTSRITQPTASFVFNPNNPVNFPSTLVKTQEFQYDTRNNLIGLTDEGGHIVAKIYGYDDKYIIGSVINADLSIDKPAYTSFEASDFGGWTISGTPVFANNIGVTGTKVLSLATGISVSASLNTAKPYILSFWASNNSLNINNGSLNGSLIKSAPTVNGYTYYEYLIPAGTSNISITTTAATNIDELRVYPSNARMTTVTYHPLLGKIAECDDNNRITYYEYDDLGRLRFIRDEEQNIIKMNEYNYKN